jgi:hypothetical protein
MSPFARWLSLTLGVLVVGFALFLLSWDIPAPEERVERPIADERLPR